MMIKLTTAFIAAAAVLSTVAQAELQCRLSTDRAHILSVDVFSDSDLVDKYVKPKGEGNFANVVLTHKYYTDVTEADRYVSMRHNGVDCREIPEAEYITCNDVEEATGNSCAQVISKVHPVFDTPGKAAIIPKAISTSQNFPVHFRAGVSTTLQYWRNEIIGTCSSQIVSTDKPIRQIHFHANNMHKWTTVAVILDEADPYFDRSWECNESTDLGAKTPRAFTSDGGKTWSFADIKFNPILYDVPSQ